MTTHIKSQVTILTKAIFHILSLIGLTITVNILPSYLVYTLMYPHPNASTYSGGLLLATTFITFIWLVDTLSRVTKTYNTLLDKTQKKNQSNDLD